MIDNIPKYKESTPVKLEPGETRETPAKPHWCGLQGFGMLGDTCPACDEQVKTMEAKPPFTTIRLPIDINKTTYPGDTRVFQTGATRDKDSDKLDYSGFISPIVLKRFSEYMHLHRVQSDGKLRSSRNWRKGMPVTSYEESLIRHCFDVWLHSEGFGKEATEDLETALCGVIFNAQGLLHEKLLVKKGLSRGRIE